MYLDKEDVRDIAIKLDKIYMQHPEDFFFIKGWIHCLLQKEKEAGQGSQKVSKSDCTAT